MLCPCHTLMERNGMWRQFDIREKGRKGYRDDKNVIGDMEAGSLVIFFTHNYQCDVCNVFQCNKIISSPTQCHYSDISF